MSEVVKKGLFSRMALPLMLLMFIAPMGAAWVVYNYFPDWVRTLGTTNYGTLIDPPVEFPLQGLSDIDGKPVPVDIMDKKWTYVFLNAGQCDRDCFDHLMIIKNVRLSQGKEVSRMKRLFVITSGHVDAELRKTLEQFPTLRTVLLTSDEQRNQMRTALATKGVQDPLNANAIYVVDPDTKVMMYYQQEKKSQQAVEGMGKEAVIKLAKGMQGDMAKLMKNSTLRK